MLSLIDLVMMPDRLIYDDFIVIIISDFGVIFATDWLARYGAIIDCEMRIVSLRVLGRTLLCFMRFQSRGCLKLFQFVWLSAC